MADDVIDTLNDFISMVKEKPLGKFMKTLNFFKMDFFIITLGSQTWSDGCCNLSRIILLEKPRPLTSLLLICSKNSCIAAHYSPFYVPF